MHIREAAKLMEKGHAKQLLKDGEFYCINGALNMATHGNYNYCYEQYPTDSQPPKMDTDHDLKFICSVIQEQFSERFPGSDHPSTNAATFNNNAETTNEDIQLVMDKAAVLAGE
jgi:hypothetical protein